MLVTVAQVNTIKFWQADEEMLVFYQSKHNLLLGLPLYQLTFQKIPFT